MTIAEIETARRVQALVKCEENRRRMDDERNSGTTDTTDSKEGGLPYRNPLRNRPAHEGFPPRTMRALDD